MLAHEEVVDDDLFFKEVKQLVTDSVSVCDAVSDRCVPGLELVKCLHDLLQVIVLDEELTSNWVIFLALNK